MPNKRNRAFLNASAGGLEGLNLLSISGDYNNRDSSNLSNAFSPRSTVRKVISPFLDGSTGGNF